LEQFKGAKILENLCSAKLISLRIPRRQYQAKHFGINFGVTSVGASLLAMMVNAFFLAKTHIDRSHWVRTTLPSVIRPDPADPAPD